MKSKARGKNFLFVVGIIYIVLSAFSLIGVAGLMVSLSALTGGDSDTALAVEQQLAATGVTADSLKVSIVLSCISVVVYLLVGILGIKNRNKPEKAGINVVFGCIILVYILGNAVYSVMQGSFVLYIVALSCILPILYLVGAILNKQSAEV